MSVYVWGVAILVALASVYFISRYMYSQQIYHSDFCPICGGSKFHRVHRRTIDRVFGIGLDTRRYRCTNPICQWEGMRQYNRSPKSWSKSEN